MRAPTHVLTRAQAQRRALCTCLDCARPGGHRCALTNVTVLSRLLGARRYAGQVLIRTVVAPLLGTNCYLVSDGRRCVVVDPGGGAADGVRAIVRTEGLAPVAILLTHGHVDHTWDAAEVSEEYQVPVRLHTADVYRLHDPLGSLGPR